MGRHVFALVLLGLTGCAMRPPMYDASAFEKKMEENRICANGKGSRIFSVTTATFVGVPSGTPLNQIAESQVAYAATADAISQNMFQLLAQVDIRENSEGVKYNSVAKPTLIAASILTWGIVAMIASVEPNDFFHPEIDVMNSPRFNNVHLVRTSNNPLEFVICQEKNCEGLREPIHGNKIYKGSNSGQPYFYSASDTAPSITVTKFDKSPLEPDPFSSAVIATGFDLHHFLGTNYFDFEQGRGPASVSEAVSHGLTATKMVKGNWVIQKVTFNPTEICKYARPASELYSD